MAETKQASKRKAKSKPRSRSSGGSKAGGSKANAASKANSSSGPIAAVEDKSKAAGHAVEEGAKQAGKAIGRAASKAKVPLIAGGAAVAGAGAGMALSHAQSRRHRGGLKSAMSSVKSDDVAKAARKAGDFGMRMGEIAYEVRRARDNSNGQAKRSPIEVVLQGLTSRGAKD